MKKYLRPKRHKQPIHYRIFAVITYTITFLDAFTNYGLVVIRRSTSLDRLTYRIPIIRWYVQFVATYRYAPFVLYNLYHRIFLHKLKPLIKLPYFVKHHFLHAIMIPIVSMAVDQVVWWFIPRSIEFLYYEGVYLLTTLHAMVIFDCIIHAANGLYLEKGILSESVEYHAGTFPREELEEVNEKGEVTNSFPKAPYGLYEPPEIYEVDILKFEGYVREAYEIEFDEIYDEEESDQNSNTGSDEYDDYYSDYESDDDSDYDDSDYDDSDYDDNDYDDNDYDDEEY